MEGKQEIPDIAMDQLGQQFSRMNPMKHLDRYFGAALLIHASVFACTLYCGIEFGVCLTKKISPHPEILGLFFLTLLVQIVMSAIRPTHFESGFPNASVTSKGLD